MSRRVSTSKFETQGRDKSSGNGEKKAVSESTQANRYSVAYQIILAKELLINDNQEEYTKYF
jgi:hypothetical protein